MPESQALDLSGATDLALDLDNGAAFFSVFRRGNLIHLYYRGKGGGFSRTMWTYSRDGIDFARPRIIMRGTHVCHNFFAFLDPNGSIRGIGGQYAPQTGKPNNEGLYAFTSTNGHRMDGGDLVVTPAHPGFVDGVKIWGKLTEMDGHLCCLFDPDLRKYVLYARSNPAEGIRHIQYATATEFGAFGEFRPVMIDAFDPLQWDNYYSPCFMRLEGEYIGFLPFVNRDYCCIRFVRSEDGINWESVSDLFPAKPWFNIVDSPKNVDHPVNGLIDAGDSVHLYIHHNYFGGGAESPVKLVRYTLDKRQLLRGRVEITDGRAVALT